jgi:hypothetical protein
MIPVFSGKNYTTPTEEKFRLKIYMENKAKIAKHNQKATKGNSQSRRSLILNPGPARGIN